MSTKKIKNSLILSAKDIQNGYIAGKDNVSVYAMSPLQGIPAEEKDEEWKKWNMDWLERVGTRCIMREAESIKRKYNLANGILDRSDYEIGSHNPHSDHIQALN